MKEKKLCYLHRRHESAPLEGKNMGKLEGGVLSGGGREKSKVTFGPKIDLSVLVSAVSVLRILR